jgi:GNAT superfamily N-acetyltransferase
MNPSPIELRTATPDDAPIVLALDPIAERASVVRRAIAESRCLVAVDGDGPVIGFCVAGEFFGFDFLELLFVAPARRRCGVGSLLVDAWEQTTTTAKLFTSTNESNVPMQRLCERRGYIRSGTIENLDDADPEIVYFRSKGEPR